MSVALTPGLERVGAPSAIAASVVAAPIVEEFSKGMGVVAIFVFARREFNGVVDGIVYAGIVAIGFAFVEDILYLARSYEVSANRGWSLSLSCAASSHRLRTRCSPCASA